MALAEKAVACTMHNCAPHTTEIEAVHPFGLVPGLRDGDITLWETAAIVQYLDECFDTGVSLRPASISGRARCTQWISAVNSQLYDTMVRRYVLLIIFSKGQGGQADRGTIDKALVNIKQQFCGHGPQCRCQPKQRGAEATSLFACNAHVLTQNQAMPPTAQPRRNEGLEALLRDAHTALDRGDVQSGRATSQKVLKAAEGLANPRYEAKALLCLAHCDRMLSRYRRAHRASQRAAQNFHLLGDISGEVMALSTHAIVSVTLGRSEEAVEAALLSVRLSQFLEHPEHSVLSYNALGVAYFWSHGFEKAEQALQTAVEIAEHAEPQLSTFQPRVNQWWNELLRVFHERYYVGAFTGLDKLRKLREAIITLIASGDAGGAAAGTHITTEAVLQFGLCLEQCWHGRIGQARLDVEVLAQWAQRYGTVTWLGALESWVRAEIAWAQADWAGAMKEAARMIDVAVQVEHEQLACLGHLLSSQMYVAQGRNGQAVDELRRLRLREQLIRADGLETREKVIEWQVDLRLRQQHVNRLEITSRHLERLSLEDSLTGIPNRRSFERYAGELLRGDLAHGLPPCVALIDVDKFKQINDNYSHQVGDEVLRNIAQILRSHIREDDMAARLAGDEFVIVFKNAELAVAQQVCQRISDAVRNFDWSSINAGLASSISIGVAAAEPGDTIETLTHRSDAAMYRHKKLRA